MSITYILNIGWMLMFCFLTIVTFVFTMFWNMCSRQGLEQTCIDFQQFGNDHRRFYSNQFNFKIKYF